MSADPDRFLELDGAGRYRVIDHGVQMATLERKGRAIWKMRAQGAGPAGGDLAFNISAFVVDAAGARAFKLLREHDFLGGAE